MKASSVMKNSVRRACERCTFEAGMKLIGHKLWSLVLERVVFGKRIACLFCYNIRDSIESAWPQQQYRQDEEIQRDRNEQDRIKYVG